MLTETDRWVGSIFSMKLDYAILMIEPFNGIFVIDDGKHDVSVLGLNRAIYHQHIAIMNIGACHGITDYAEEKCCCLIAYQVAIQIEAFLYVLVCWRGESGGDAMLQ